MTKSRASTSPAADATAFLSTPAITLRWLVRLRWGAVLGQAATIAATSIVFQLALPLKPLIAILVATVATNLALVLFMQKPRAISPHFVAAVLAFDTLSLGGLLYFSGGPSNPFSVLFLVQITISSLVLGARYSAAIVALSACVYAFLFFDNVPLAGMEHMHHSGTSAFNLHLQGMFVAFALAAILIAYFVTRVSSALRERDAQLEDAQRRVATNLRVASLSTLAAGAAHELGTPLATIKVASKELLRAAQLLEGKEALALAEDARLIHAEVDRCRDIVQQMGARAGAMMGEAPERVDVARVVDEVRARLDENRAPRLEPLSRDVAPFAVPLRGLVQTLGSLVKNGFDASDSKDARVHLEVESIGTSVRFTITDEGAGMTTEELSRVGEPFFTTKEPGAGMGLGVFLARAFVDQLGGALTFDSTRGKGTRAIVEIPMKEI